MHCPKCGQQQVSDETRYCSRCGLLLTGVSAVVANNGELPASSAASGKKDSPRKRGVKQGAFIFLLAFLVVPLLALFHLLTGTEPFLAVGAMILFAGGAVLRVAWALLFESGESLPAEAAVWQPVNIGGSGPPQVLPASKSIPASVYTAPGAGAWRDTNELSTPGSVTDSTTKLLAKEEDAQ